MTAFRKKPLFVLFFITVFSSCLTYQEVEVINAEEIKIKKMSSKEIELDVALKIKNPNNFKIVILNSDLDIYLNDASVGKAVVKDKIIIPKKSEETYSIQVSAKFKNVLSGMLHTFTSFLGKKDLHMKIKGEVKVKAIWMRKKFNVEWEEDIAY